MTIELWHCKNARSLRPLWALEEMGLEYRLHILPFPPRVHQREYLDVNMLGTVPYLKDGATAMTESTGMCHYLATRYGKSGFLIAPEHAEYGSFLNWLYHSDATLTFPQALIMRYSSMEPEERRQPQVVDDYRLWYLRRLKLLDAHIEQREYLCDGRFTIADIAIGYALFLGETLAMADEYTPQTRAYLERLKSRPAFIKAQAIG